MERVRSIRDGTYDPNDPEHMESQKTLWAYGMYEVLESKQKN